MQLTIQLLILVQEALREVQRKQARLRDEHDVILGAMRPDAASVRRAVPREARARRGRDAVCTPSPYVKTLHGRWGVPYLPVAVDRAVAPSS